MDELYGNLSPNDDDDEEVQKKAIPVYIGTELAEISPNDMIAYDMKNEQLIHDQTDALETSMIFCEQIVTAAYKVTEYVPDLSNNQYAAFWKEQVIPNLVTSLTQDVRARSIIVRSLSSIRDLGINIQKAGAIMQETRGSPKAIEIAQKNIPAALKTLENCIELASTLENSAIQTFASQTKALFEIIGPEAVQFVKEKAQVQHQLNDLYDQQQKLYAELGQKQGEVKGLCHLINATEKQLNVTAQGLEATRMRTDELKQINSNVEKTIASIPVSTPQTVTTTTHTNYGRWWWRHSSSTTRTDTVMVPNSNRETDKHYYESIVLSRMARIRENQNDEAAKQRAIDDLNVSLSGHTSKYEQAKTDLENCKNALPAKIASLQQQIDVLHQRIVDLDKKEIDVGNKVGHHGNTLIQCLIEVRTFAKSIKGGASAYAPLVSILNGVKAMIQNDVELLTSTRVSDVFLAGNRLLKQVQFLSNYSLVAGKALQSSAQYNSLANAIEFKAKKAQENN
ncbi:unnamed protein product [Adineta steineri]|uniref:Uncharacterized protein n=1 Tax=Adineta steineri TaxID=433720 RepID=A0A814QZ03_9BILA|nr:unnamed protein product [Adineta steineri]CAF1126476.1 unnamed protein product [Adineta steineri]CAF3954434.1 unnamed protein product [Adineta steineri]CAF4110494.1 unnamed protein product [Adineta steineri]